MKNLILSLLLFVPQLAIANSDVALKQYMISTKQVVAGVIVSSARIAVLDGQNARVKSSVPQSGYFTRFEVKPQSLSDGRIHMDLGFKHKSERQSAELVTEVIVTEGESLHLPMNGDPTTYLEVQAKAL
jgi:hypothetical protein